MALGDDPIVDSAEPRTPVPGVNQFQPNTNIFTDPRFLAFGRQTQFQSGQQISDAREQQRLAQIELQRIVPRLREQGIEQREQIQGALESRGLFRSGERLQEEARSRRGEERAVSDLRTGTAQTIADLEEQVARIRANASAAAQDQALLTAGDLRSQVPLGFQQAIQQRELELLQQLSGVFGAAPGQFGSIDELIQALMPKPGQFTQIGDTRVQTDPTTGQPIGL